MVILNVDTSNPDLLDRKYDPIPKGIYIMEIENELVVEDSKNTPGNQIVKVELRVMDDEEYKGRKVFDTLVISSDPETAKKCEWKIAQIAISSGICTKETLKDGVDIGELKGKVCNVKIGVKPKTDEYDAKNVVKEYMYEDEDTSKE